MMYEPWTQSGKNSQRLAYASYPFGFPLQLHWMADLGLENPMLGAPIIVDNVVYVCSTQQLFAVSFETGEIQWQFTPDLIMPKHYPNEINSNLAFCQGRVYFCDQLGTQFCVEAQTGQLLWQQRLMSLGGAILCAFEHTLFVPFRETDRQGCLAFDLDGNILWQFETSTFSALRGIAVDRQHLIYSDKSGRVWALEPPTGQIIWTYQPSDDNAWYPIGHTILTPKVIIFLSSYEDFRLDCITGMDLKTGKLRWQTHFMGPISCNGREVITFERDSDNNNYHLCRINVETGNLHRIATPSTKLPTHVTQMTVIIGNTWIVARQWGLEAYDVQTGQIVWSFDARTYEPDYIDDGKKVKDNWLGVTSPAFASGRLVFGSGMGKLYCFGEGPTGGSEGKQLC